MIPKLTDDAVSRLPVESGRAELLEEIMSAVAPDRQTAEPTTPARHRSRWLAPLAAAAVVVGIAGSSVWWQQNEGGRDGGQGAAGPVAQAQQLPGGGGVVLDAAGWTVDSLSGDGLVYRKGEANLEISSYDAASYDSYVRDREHIVEPPTPGEPIEVLGRPAQMWAYSADDHTAIREVEDGRWLEFRAQGLDEAAYLALLGQLRVASQGQFEATLPEGHVTEDERLPEALRIVGEITAASGAALPEGTSSPIGDGDAKDRYQFGAEVAGAYACAWLEAFENATTHGQTSQAAEAARVLSTSRDWPVLREMAEAGDYPEVLWQVADEAAAGRVPEGYREALGCS